jgi:glycosyltransferase involved in cell wall biosynthesis
MKKPLISVLMTIHNHESYLKSSIYSVINQSYNKWELVAIENGSTDESKKILKKIKNKNIKKIYLKKNIGRTNALNYGLKFCKGKYIAILDSDDIAKKHRLKIQLNRMEKFKDLWLTSSSYEIINEKNSIIKYVTINEDLYNFPRRFLFKNLIGHSTVFYKKKLLKKIGFYPSKFKYAQDYAFFLKIFKKFKLEITQQKLVKIRKIHSNSESYRQSKNLSIIFEEIRLLYWSYKNFNLSSAEKILIYCNLIKKLIKIIKIKFYFILIPFIIFFFKASFFE